MTQGVYIIHADEKVSHAQHYVGWSDNIEERLEEHKKTVWEPLEEPIHRQGNHFVTGSRTYGAGSCLLAFMNYKGIKYQIAKIYEGADRHFEKALKDTNNTTRYCPICNPNAKEYRPRGNK